MPLPLPPGRPAKLLTHPPPTLHCLCSCQGWAWPAAMWEGPQGALPAQGVHSGRQRPGWLAVTCPNLGGPTGRHTLTTHLPEQSLGPARSGARSPKLLLSIGLPSEVMGRLRAQSRPPHLLPHLPGNTGPWGWGTEGKGDRVIALPCQSAPKSKSKESKAERTAAVTL